LGSRLREKGLINISLEKWKNLRIKAEKKTASRSINGQTTLDSVYDHIAEELKLSPAKKLEAKKMEIMLEKESIRIVPGIKASVEKARLDSGRVFFISDMYIPGQIIKTFLKINNVWNKKDSIYVSCDHGLSKSSGTLYNIVLEQESIQPCDLNHTGDNIDSDYHIPRGLQINSTHFTETCLNRYEKALADSKSLDKRFSSLIAGASRVSRLNVGARDDREKVIRDIGCSVAGPVLLGYVIWCLLEAEKQGIKRLYFLSRDGQVLLKIANIICKKWNIDIECKYLYTSRHAFHSSLITSADENYLDIIFDFTSFLSVDSLFERVNLDPIELGELLEKSGFSRETWNKNLGQKQRERLKMMFLEPEVRLKIKRISDKSRINTIGYLLQEGMDSKSPWAIVDMGWKGRVQSSLSKLLDAGGFYPKDGVKGFYFGLLGKIEPYKKDLLKYYFFNTGNRYNINFYHYIAIYELFTSGTHGLVLKYALKEEKYYPVLKSPTNEEGSNWGLSLLQESIIRFSEEFTGVYKKDNVDFSNFLAMSRILLKLFLKEPVKCEAEVFGTYKTSEDQTEHFKYEISPKIDIAYFWKCFIFGKQYLYKLPWVEGSILRSFKNSKFLIMLIKTRRFLGQILRNKI